MTRDEAIQISYKGARACEPYRSYTHKELLGIITFEIDNFVALGILELEEPENQRELMVDALDGLVVASVSLNSRAGSGMINNYTLGESEALQILNRLSKCGLELVKK